MLFINMLFWATVCKVIYLFNLEYWSDSFLQYDDDDGLEDDEGVTTQIFTIDIWTDIPQSSNFTSAFTKSRNYCVSWAVWMQSTAYIYLKSISMLTIYLYRAYVSQTDFSFDALRPKFSMHFAFSPRVLHFQHLILVYLVTIKISCKRKEVMRLLVMYFSPFPWY